MGYGLSSFIVHCFIVHYIADIAHCIDCRLSHCKIEYNTYYRRSFAVIMEVLLDQLSIGTQDVTRVVDDSAYILPKQKYAALYQKLDENMTDKNNTSLHSTNVIIKDLPMREDGESSTKSSKARNNKSVQKRETRLRKRQSVALKTVGIKASRRCTNNMEKRIRRYHRKKIKNKRNARVEQKTRTKQAMKNMNQTLASFKIK